MRSSTLRRFLVFGLALALLDACEGSDPSGSTPEERVAEHALGVPTVIRGSDDEVVGVVGRFDPPSASSIDPVLTAEWFLGELGDLWGITSPPTELMLAERTDGDPGPLGRPTASLVYQRLVEGFEVVGARLSVRVEDGFVTSVMGVIPRNLQIATTPGVSDADAIATVLEVEAGTADTADLVVVSEGLFEGLSTSPSALAWRVRVSAGIESSTRFVDAASGALLELVIRGAADARQRRVSDRGDTLCADEMPPITDADMCVAWIRMAPQVYDESGPVMGATPGADATACWGNLGSTYDMLGRFGRDSFDGSGGAFDAFVQVKEIEGDFEAAALDSPRILLFSRGMATLDVVAHESGHLFLFSEGFLNASDDAGAIHEAFGDILGAIADDATPWTIGDGSRVGVIRTLTTARTLADVTAGGDPHDNALVLGYAFYSASDVHGATREKAGKIYINMADLFLLPGATLEGLWMQAWLSGRTLAENSSSGITYADCSAVLNGLHDAGIGEGDRDGDCVPNDIDICPDYYNPNQADSLECLRPFGSCQITPTLCVNYHKRDDTLRNACETGGGVWTEDACVEEEADAACVLFIGSESIQIEVYYDVRDQALTALQCFLRDPTTGGPGIYTPAYIRPTL